MNTSAIFSERVVNVLRGLPAAEQTAITSALTAEFVYGTNPDKGLSPLQSILYTMIRSYVERDMHSA